MAKQKKNEKVRQSAKPKAKRVGKQKPTSVKIKTMRKPGKDRIALVYARCGGNLSETARVLNVDRGHLYTMMNAEPELREMMDTELSIMIHEVEQAAITMAKGIPRYEWVDIMDEHGNPVDRRYVQVGWVEKPDPQFAKIILAARARNRGYGQQDTHVQQASSSITIEVTRTVVERGVVDGDGKVHPLQ